MEEGSVVPRWSSCVLVVTLIGACGTCPASSQTLKAGIERIMRDRIDGVTEVVNVVPDEL